MLSERQKLILQMVVENYLQFGNPVGSRALAERPEVEWGPSTIRYELSQLEEEGLLAHPHTSAGRVPTEAGYRFFVDELIERAPTVSEPQLPELSLKQELDDAMRVTVETLSQVTDLLAIISAPPVDAATIRHIEILALQQHVVMVVVITSTGGVSKKVLTFNRSVDPGLVEWAKSYLNERLVGIGLGARTLRQRIAQDSLSQMESQFLNQLLPAFTSLEQTSKQSIYFDGTARLLDESRVDDISEVNELLEMLEKRAALLGLLQHALVKREPVIKIGTENRSPALRSLALIACGYGLPQRNLGTVSVIGPIRMDYPTAIHSVKEAAGVLSRYVDEMYSARDW